MCFFIYIKIIYTQSQKEKKEKRQVSIFFIKLTRAICNAPDIITFTFIFPTSNISRTKRFYA